MALEYTWFGPSADPGAHFVDGATTDLSALTWVAADGTDSAFVHTGSVTVTGAGNVTIRVPLPHIPSTINGRLARIKSVVFTLAKAAGATTTNFITEAGIVQETSTIALSTEVSSTAVTYTTVFQQTTNELAAAASATPSALTFTNEGVALDALNASAVRLSADGLLHAYVVTTLPASDTWTLRWYMGSKMKIVMDYATD